MALPGDWINQLERERPLAWRLLMGLWVASLLCIGVLFALSIR